MFRYDLKGKVLWKHPLPVRKANFLLSYRSFNLVLFIPTGIEYWDKYGFAISTFHLPGAEHASEDCYSVSQDGRYLSYLDDLGVLRQVDVGKVLAQHLISASKIFMEELKRLGTITPGAEENLQWAIESMNDGDVQYALSFGSQAYSSMETTLDSLPARKPAPAPAEPGAAPAAPLPPAAQKMAPQGPPANATELYKKGLREIFSVKEEPGEIEWNLLGILREAFSITPEQHDTYEEEVKSELKAAGTLVPGPQAPAITPASRPAMPGLVRPTSAMSSQPPVSYTPAARPAPTPSYVPREMLEQPVEAEKPAAPAESPEIALDEAYLPSTPEPAQNPEEVETFTVEPEAEKEAHPAPIPAAQAPEPFKATPTELPKMEKPEPAPQPAQAAKPAEAAANFNMDNYVSDILGKYLKK